MKKIAALLSIMVLASCGIFRKPLPEGAPERISEKNLVKEVLKAENDFETLSFKANCKFKFPDGNTQSFKLTVRMIKDSLVWISIGDPFIGISLAKAVIYEDSAVFTNKIERNYYNGDLKSLQEEFKINLGFNELCAILSGNLIQNNLEDFKLSYIPNFYLLANNNNGSIPDKAGEAIESEYYSYKINPETKKAEYQEYASILNNQGLSFETSDWVLGDFKHPNKVTVYFQNGTERSVLTMDVRSLDVDLKLSYPISIPSSYAPIK